MGFYNDRIYPDEYNSSRQLLKHKIKVEYFKELKKIFINKTLIQMN
jgi:hypothetical protein